MGLWDTFSIIADGTDTTMRVNSTSTTILLVPSVRLNYTTVPLVFFKTFPAST